MFLMRSFPMASLRMERYLHVGVSPRFLSIAMKRPNHAMERTADRCALYF
jgi:hypothetical protein